MSEIVRICHKTNISWLTKYIKVFEIYIAVTYWVTYTMINVPVLAILFCFTL